MTQGNSPYVVGQYTVAVCQRCGQPHWPGDTCPLCHGLNPGDPCPLGCDLKIAQLDQRLKAYHEALDKICCLVAEGPELLRPIQIYQAVAQEVHQVFHEPASQEQKSHDMIPAGLVSALYSFKGLMEMIARSHALGCDPDRIDWDSVREEFEKISAFLETIHQSG